MEFGVGDTVVCVCDDPHSGDARAPRLKRGAKYTISWAHSHFCLVHGHDHVNVSLHETGNVMWDAERFRKADPDQQQEGIIARIKRCKPYRKREPEGPARVPDKEREDA